MHPMACDCRRCRHRERSWCGTCSYAHDYDAFPEGPRDEDEPLSEEDEHINALAALSPEEYAHYIMTA